MIGLDISLHKSFFEESLRYHRGTIWGTILYGTNQNLWNKPQKKSTFGKQLTSEHPFGEYPLGSKPLENQPSSKPTLRKTFPLGNLPCVKPNLFGINPPEEQPFESKWASNLSKRLFSLF